ncbi:ABC transporter permease [Labrys monachus]|uniref:NitT/TauT family transport system permease protein n=1 Tax=Labrys monachus TaxID=217067 RepID=A0ABU0F728_9HYPH|nr:ABC transporter permease [Labrys monachus]MDQ0390416.1 NitT/TauT family transport system permease protein [Labrys monachus]
MTLSKSRVDQIKSIVFIALLFVFWEVACVILSVSPIVLPRPSAIVSTLILQMPALWPHILQTLATTIIGFIAGMVIGVALGAAVGVSRTAYSVAYPLLVGFSSIPKVAVVPIFVLWFGSGTVPAILTALTTCIFPIVVNVATGLATTEPEMEDVLKALGANRSQVFWNVSLPRTMPYFFASLKVAVTLAFVGTVLSETVAANRGIGTVMMMATASFDVPLAFAGLFALALLGILLYVVFAIIEQRVCGWANRKQEFATG